MPSLKAYSTSTENYNRDYGELIDFFSLKKWIAPFIFYQKKHHGLNK